MRCHPKHLNIRTSPWHLREFAEYRIDECATVAEGGGAYIQSVLGTANPHPFTSACLISITPSSKGWVDNFYASGASWNSAEQAGDMDLWHIRYEDGDAEDLGLAELAAVLVPPEEGAAVGS